MAQESRRITIPPESPLARELRAAVIADRSLELDTGEAIYQVHVSCTRAAAPVLESVERSIAGIRAAAGSWRDVDVAGFRAYLAARRRLHTRPPVTL